MRVRVFTCLLAASFLTAGDLRLIEAVKDQNHKAISSLLGERVDVNAPQPDGATPLAWAVYLDQPDTVDVLLKAGAKVNTADEYGETPLTLACSTGNTSIIRKLVEAGADVKAERWNGETALMIAARSGSLEGVQLLLSRGAKVNAVESNKGQNALMWAAAAGHSEIVDALIKAGADVQTASKAGFTPLVFAAQKGSEKSVSSLLEAGVDPNYKLTGGNSVLLLAVAGGKTHAAEVLLDKGAEVNAADSSGITPLHAASQSGNLELVKKLLEKGANPNLRTAHIARGLGAAAGPESRGVAGEQTPLLMAARANHEDVMRALVAAGADPKLKAQDGSTLLMAAAGSGHVGVVKYAFALSPEINAVTTRKTTVMHAAVSGTMASSTQPEIVKVIQFLADKGAALDPEDAKGRTPIFIADFLPIDKAVDLLTKLILQSGNTPKTPSKR